MTAWLPLVAALLACAGMLFLALAMDRHRRQLLQRPGSISRPYRATLRSAALTLLALSLLASAQRWGAAIGVVGWFGLLTIGALIVLAWLAARGPQQRQSASRSRSG